MPDNRAPRVNAGLDQSVDEGAAVTLTGAATDQDGTVTGVHWTQTAGPTVTVTGADTATLSFVAPTVDVATILSFSLAATDNEGGSASDSVNVVVQDSAAANRLPIADAGTNQLADEGSNVTLTGSGHDDDGRIAGYQWTQVSGSPRITPFDAAAASPRFTAPQVFSDTEFGFELVVTDDRGARSAADRSTVVVRNIIPVNQSPTANAGADQNVNEGVVVILTGSGIDADGTVQRFAWTQTAGPNVPLINPDTARLSFTAPPVDALTTLTFSLTVTDDSGDTAIDTIDVRVQNIPAANLPPVAAAGADRSADAFDRVALDSSGSSDPERSVLSPAWTQISGPAAALSGANTAQPWFEAPDVAAATPLVFQLTVTDTGGLSDTDDITITVQPLPDFTGLVDPRIGSVVPGFTNPGPVVPFGMVGLGPDTEGPLNYGGYYIQNALITGFSHVHMTAGVFKGGYFPVLPFTGTRTSGDLSQLGYPQPVPAYASAFEHATETAEAGYYSVRLLRYGVLAELTASERVGLHRYTFQNPALPPRLLLDLSRNLNGLGAAIVRISADGTLLSGQSDSDDGFPVFFAARLSAPFTAKGFDGAPLVPGAPLSGNALGLELDFAALNGPLLLKLAVSYTDETGAIANLAEIQGFDFNATRAAAHSKWKRALARIRVVGGTSDQQTSFYTALYRLHHFPNLHSDVDGRYRGPDGAPHANAERPHYSQFSSWDSYRGQNAMQAELFPDIYRDMVRSLLDFHAQAGYLPRWQQGPHDASHMSGDPIIPFIGEAWCRGELDAPLRAQLWPALLDMPANRSPELSTLGFLPVPVPASAVEQVEGGSGRAGTTLEYGIADFSLALMAQDAAPAQVAAITQRSLIYRNLLDPETKWIRPRHANGAWLTPFAPELGYGFQEGTSWQYSWLAMHDLAGLYERMGGNSAVDQRLDTFFNFPASQAPLVWPTIQNQITTFGTTYYGNQFAPGNEHDLQAPYLYNYTGAPWKTQAVARAAASIYTAAPNGLPGNDDLGGLSGWLLWTMMGIYPINPGTPLYVVGSPHFERVTLKRTVGDLVIEAPGASAANRFVAGAFLDAAPLEKSWLVLPRGPTTIRFDTSPLPALNWAATPAARPPSLSTHSLESFGCKVD